MAYIPNPNRKVKNGKAMVSAKELADFKKQYGEDKTLRDLLNMDKGLRRRGENSTLTSSAKKDILAKPADAPKKAPPGEYKPKLKSELSPAERKKHDQMESSQALEGSHPELLLLPAGRVLSAVARPLATADKLRSTVTTGVNAAKNSANAVKNSAPAKAVREAQFTRAAAKDADDIAAAAQAKETAEAVARANKFNSFSFKRGGAVKMASGGITASRRGDGIAQRGKTKGRMR
jgi:hypothetical protein